MSTQKIRFIHASDFQLGRPVLYFSDGIESRRPPVFIPADIRTELPDSFYEHYTTASFQSAKNVFDAAIKHRVNFVLITGDVFYNGEADAYAIRFFDQQLRRLEEQGIWVCWVVENDASPTDTAPTTPMQAWWDCQPMPENVAIFSGDKPCKKSFRIAFGQDGPHASTTLDNTDSRLEPDVSLIYVPRGAAIEEGYAATNSACEILMGTLPDLKRLAAKHDFTYGCVLGESRRKTYGAKFENPNTGEYFFHAPGATQGYSPAVFRQKQRSEQPIHGCSLIEFDSETLRIVSTIFIVTETISWRLQCIDLPPEVVDFQSVGDLLRRESLKFAVNQPSADGGTLVVWFLHSQLQQHASLLAKIHLENQSLVRENCTKTIFASLRHESEKHSPQFWHLAVLTSPESFPTPDEQQSSTIARDFQNLIALHQDLLRGAGSELSDDDANSPLYPFTHHSLILDDFLTEIQRADILNLLAAPLPDEASLGLLADAELLGTTAFLNCQPAASSTICAASSEKQREEADSDY